jgi:hypothetical protein
MRRDGSRRTLSPLRATGEPMTKQHSKPRRNVRNILRGIMCSHRRMRRVTCAYCTSPCAVWCPDCALFWLLED